jgi:hypothetical protein
MRISIVVALFLGVKAITHKENQKEELSLISRLYNTISGE